MELLLSFWLRCFFYFPTLTFLVTGTEAVSTMDIVDHTSRIAAFVISFIQGYQIPSGNYTLGLGLLSRVNLLGLLGLGQGVAWCATVTESCFPHPRACQVRNTNSIPSKTATGSAYRLFHYNDVIMRVISSQITNLTIVYSTIYSGADQRKHQSSASLAFVPGIHRSPVNSPHKCPVTRKMFPFDDVIMYIRLCLVTLSKVWWSACPDWPPLQLKVKRKPIISVRTSSPSQFSEDVAARQQKFKFRTFLLLDGSRS